MSDLIASLAAPFNREPDERCPSILLYGIEGRALLELASLPWTLPLLLRDVPRGDGHSVLVLPGLLASDHSTSLLRRFLRSRGYDVHGWKQGNNLGPREGLLEALQHRVESLHQTSGRKISLIGWSLGGVYARELARAMPEKVRQVITLGSPLYGAPETSSNAWQVFRFLTRGQAVDESARGNVAPPVPTTSIYSRADGVVGWGCSVERPGPMTDNIEINVASHLGLGVNPLVWYAVGDRLALPEDGWTHFAPRGLYRSLFPFKAPVRS
ncbi:esterase/lipase family protein [Cupriavidus numazuensis]|uniref:Alpha/beta hydrolase n=1 Tax=Cupriavidus numazuensis TaxID=221992 RepID=A0ABM8TTW3_9BURK|nr:esterase [Cupriavidus numazuensis]CAG2159848.1 hypothetical protein LMG26411_07029 [Cupriavidus numazuensis]